MQDFLETWLRGDDVAQLFALVPAQRVDGFELGLEPGQRFEVGFGLGKLGGRLCGGVVAGRLVFEELPAHAGSGQR